MEELKEGWRKVKLGEIVEYVARGITPKYTEEKESILVINQKCIRNMVLNLELAKKHDLSKKISKDKILKKYDILINSTGVGTLGRVCQNFNDILLTVDSHVTILRADSQKINPLYLGYAIKNKEKLIESLGEGSTGQTELKKDILLERIQIDYPQNSFLQEKIVSILSSLDEKIELSRKINQNLEEITQTLFKRWFIDFEFPNEEGKPYKSSGGKMIESELGEIPEGWRVGKLGEILGLRKENISKEELLENLIYLPIDCLPKKSLAVTEIKSSKEAESSLQLFYENDIVFGAVRAYFHKIIVSPFIGITRKTCFVLKIKEIEKFCFGIMTIYQDKTVKYANAHSKGSTMPYAVWENGLEDMPILIPENNLLTLFNKKLISNFEMIKKNSLQNFKLISIRDYLLPKLMNGEINVSNLKISEISNSDLSYYLIQFFHLMKIKLKLFFSEYFYFQE